MKEICRNLYSKNYPRDFIKLDNIGFKKEIHFPFSIARHLRDYSTSLSRKEKQICIFTYFARRTWKFQFVPATFFLNCISFKAENFKQKKAKRTFPPRIYKKIQLSRLEQVGTYVFVRTILCRLASY